MRNQELKQFMTAKGFIQRQIAQKLGVSITTISQYLNGSYEGRTDELDKKVEELIALHRTKLAETKYNREFVMTFAAKRGLEVIMETQAEGDIGVIYGAAGLGKTQILKQYAKENSSAVLIEVDPSCNPKVLLRKIANAVGANVNGVNNDLLEGIVAKLKDSERVLLIDEAELLSTRSLEFIRRIRDATSIGVVLSGMPRLLINLRGKNGDLAQLYSRVGFTCNLGNALPEKDLALLVENSLGTSEFNEAFIQFSRGNARRLNELLRGVVRVAKNHGYTISKELIETYSQMLIH